MFDEIVNLALSMLALCSGVACIVADYRNQRRAVYVFKPLTMAIVLVLAAQAAPSTPSVYAWAVLVGLGFSIVGDVLLMLPTDRFAAGLASFLLAHVAYIVAFSSGVGFPTSLDSLALLLVLAGAFYARLLPGLGALRAPVLVYTLVIAAMAWQAIERWRSIGDVGALFAVCGALAFVTSDAVLAQNRFHRSFRPAQALVLGIYFLAQLLIALSVGPGIALVDWSIR